MKDISYLDMELVQRILRSEQTFFVQLVSVSILAVVVFVALQICNKVVERVTRGAAYVPTVVAVGKHKLKNMLGMDVSDELSLNFWVEMWGICLQHAIGGALCLPILYPSWFPGVSHASALAMMRWGALCEVAWEVTDVLKRIYERCFLPNGADLQPNTLLYLIFCHHSLSTLLVVPANVLYGNILENDESMINRYKMAYPEFIFSMQAAAAIALLVLQYTQALDLKKSASALSQMFWLSIFSLVIMLWTRGIHYWWCVYRLLMVVYSDGRMGIWAVSFVIMNVLFPLLGILFFIDGAKRTKKYGQLYFELIISGRKDTKKKELFKSMSMGLQTASLSMVSPQYTPGAAAQWTKLRSAAVMMTAVKQKKTK